MPSSDDASDIMTEFKANTLTVLRVSIPSIYIASQRQPYQQAFPHLENTRRTSSCEHYSALHIESSIIPTSLRNPNSSLPTYQRGALSTPK